jgi:thermitase
MPNSQRGATPILILIAIIGIIVFIVVSSSAPFKDSLLNTLFPKPSSEAALNNIQLGTLKLTPNGNSIAIQLPIAGDDNNNATSSVEYKKSTDNTWTQGPALNRAAVQGIQNEAGSVKAAISDSIQVDPDAVIVKFKKEIPEEDRKALISKFNITFDSSIQSKDTEQVTEKAPVATNIFNRVFRTVIPNRVAKPKLDIIRFKVSPANRDQILQQLRANPDVEYAELDVIGQSLFTPNDPQYNITNQWDLTQINAPAAWDISQGDPSVIVAMIDTGLNINHQDIAGRVVPGYDFINNTATIIDCYGHGTAVAGRIAATTNNGLGIASLGSNVKIMSIRDADCSGIFFTFRLAQALNFAASKPGVKVINISQGLSGPYADQPVVKDAIDYVTSKGILVVAAAGNDGCCNRIFYPAAYPNVIAVGATTSSGGAWSGSSTGPQLDVVAPGAGVYTTKMSGGYGSASGTSFASPQVAALAALIFSVNPNLTSQQVTNIILGTVDDLGTPGKDDQYGYGRINARKALIWAQAGGPQAPFPTAIPTATPNPTIVPTPAPTLVPATPSPVVTALPTIIPSVTPTPVVFNKLLSTNITELAANTDYDIRITVTDPDGFLEGSGVILGQVTTGLQLAPTSSTTVTSVTASPGSCNTHPGLGTVAWINTDLAKANDNKFAGVPLATTSGTLTSNILACFGFGFNIPGNASIKGIKVSIKRARDVTAGSALDEAVRLIKSGTPSVGDRSSASQYNVGVIIDEHGGETDLWGDTWTPTQINASSFGTAFVTKGNVSVGVDNIAVTVYYTP